MSGDWTMFCKVSLGDGIQDGGGIPMLPGLLEEASVTRYVSLLASMVTVSGSVILVY
jgi:hypothetical protein